MTRTLDRTCVAAPPIRIVRSESHYRKNGNGSIDSFENGFFDRQRFYFCKYIWNKHVNVILWGFCLCVTRYGHGSGLICIMDKNV